MNTKELFQTEMDKLTSLLLEKQNVFTDHISYLFYLTSVKKLIDEFHGSLEQEVKETMTEEQIIHHDKLIEEYLESVHVSVAMFKGSKEELEDLKNDY